MKIKNYDIERHVKGESQFVDDIAVPEGLLYATVYVSEKAHGELIKIDLDEAKNIAGVKGIFTDKDIPDIKRTGLPNPQLSLKLSRVSGI